MVGRNARVPECLRKLEAANPGSSISHVTVVPVRTNKGVAIRGARRRRQYGFISGGGGSWYSQTLKLLSPDDRVWVKIPKTGYVGVGRVTEAVRPIKEFAVETPSGMRPALDILKHADRYKPKADDHEKAEYFVRVSWLDTFPESKAVNEVGLFGNQNTVCQPTTPKWRHTVERLKTYFAKWDRQS